MQVMRVQLETLPRHSGEFEMDGSRVIQASLPFNRETVRYGDYDIQPRAKRWMFPNPGQGGWGASANVTRWADGSAIVNFVWSQNLDTEADAISFALNRSIQWVDWQVRSVGQISRGRPARPGHAWFGFLG